MASFSACFVVFMVRSRVSRSIEQVSTVCRTVALECSAVPDLLKRFSVGQATLTPSFAEKPSPGVNVALEALDRHGVQRRIATVGDRFAAGDVTIDVLHPPEKGPAGNENARSLVLLVHHGEHTFLL